MRVLEATCVAAAGADAALSLLSPGAVAVEQGQIVVVGTRDRLRARFPDAERLRLGDAILLPGFVNAHQHGRGLSQIQLGYPDDALEPWIARRRGRGAPDSYALTRLAAAQMIANGVTATLHANYSYATGDYERELRGAIRAYDEAGMRATICVGYADQGGLVYPPADENAFREALPPAAQALLNGARPAYLPLAETLALMARLLDDYGSHPRLTFAYGPAGPQWVSDAAWRALAQDAARRGIGLHFHLLESPAQAQTARALYPDGVLAHLEALGVFAARASAAHFTQATPADIASAARLGLTIVANPGSNMRLFNGPPAIAAWRAAGLAVAVGTDNCAVDDTEDYLRELRIGALLARGTQASGPRTEAARMLAMGTTAGAQAAFQTGTGRIAPGFRADLVAIDLARIRGAYLDADADLLDAAMARGCGADITLTMVEGDILYRRGETAEAAGIPAAAAITARAARSAAPGTGAASEDIAAALRRHYADRPS